MLYIFITLQNVMQLFERNDPGIQRDTEKKCMLCSKDFKIGRKEHQCKKCFRAVCSDCGKDKNIVFMQGFVQQPHRNCKLCVQETKTLKQYINSNKMVFGTMSIIGEKWIKKLEKQTPLARNEHKKSRNFNREGFNRMWDSYNYALRQFIGLLTFHSSQQDVYSLVLTVINGLQQAFPQQNVQTLAYLSVFLLCFCTPDNAILLGMQLIELKDTVADCEGLMSAYLKALGMSQQDKIRAYVKSVGNKFVSNVSINFANINSSIYLVQKLISRKKFDEVYMFFTLSLDVIKDFILNQKSQVKYCNLLLVRNCNPSSISGKYRQTSSVKSSFFIRGTVSVNSSMDETCQEDKRTPMLAKFRHLSHNADQKYQQTPKFTKKNTLHSTMQRNRLTSNCQQNRDQSPEDGLSMLSIIQQLNGASIKRNQQSSPQFFSVFSQNGATLSPIRLSPNQKQLKSNYCVNCEQHKAQIESLKKQIQQHHKLSDTINLYKQENQKLKQKLRRFERQSLGNQSSARQNLMMMQKGEMESQLKKMKQSLAEFQSKSKEYQLSEIRLQEANKINRRLEVEIRLLQTQNEEATSNIQILTNRLQSYALEAIGSQRQGSQRQSLSTDGSISQTKIADLLKQSVKQKNIQIEELTKKNKLMTYQIQQANLPGRDSREKTVLKQKLQKLQSEREGLMRKIKEISDRLLEEECEKFKLSEDNFILKQILREKRIIFE